MAIKGVDTKCYILALFVRDDGERFLLGSGHYEFKDTQMHFAANAIQNDIVEVQGNDGFLLAGQVRRPGTQSFDGYVGDGTMSKEETESYRRQFFSFFRKNYFYKVIYVFSDSTAIQRKSGFLVDDPTVEELYQMYPEYHVALNFEDVNYYSYSEDEEGQEQYAKEATIDTSSMRATGGLVWDNIGVVWEDTQWGGEQTASGTEFTVQNDLSLPAPVTDTRLNGDTYQQTYRGKNLAPSWNSGYTISRNGGVGATYSVDGNSVTVNTQRRGWGIYLSRTQAANLSRCPYLFQDGYVVSVTLSATTSGEIRMGSEGEAVNVNVGTEPVRVSFETHADKNIIFYQQSEGTLEYTISDIQCELGSTATDFEPYVGGTASPNPDYPQDVNVVTGRQVVAVTGEGGESAEYEINLGKNLFDKNNPNVIVGTVEAGGYNASGSNKSFYLKCESNTTYTIQKRNDGDTNRFIIATANTIPVQGTAMSGLTQKNNDSSVTITTGNDAKYIVCTFYRNTEATLTEQELIDSIQVEVGDTATTYASYFEPIELCKIGNYQDYIYKNGDDWYLHKEIGKVVYDGTENWTFGSASALRVLVDLETNMKRYTTNALCSHLAYGDTGSASEDNVFNIGGSKVFAKATAITTSASSWKTWLKTHNVSLYYQLSTITDTQITDATLVGQLNVLGAMKLFIGENNLAIQATGTNLPGPLSFKYYSTVSFDGAGLVWEEGGSGGATVVEVDSITNTYPIWRVKGPAVDPQLSVINANTTIRYTGTVTSTQTLEIDMFNKTAKLNGVSVIGNVSGDWVSLAPGTNRVIYTAENADAQPSTIEWQEVVG